MERNQISIFFGREFLIKIFNKMWVLIVNKTLELGYQNVFINHEIFDRSI